MKFDNNLDDFDALENEHIGTSENTPMRNDAFKLSREEKIDIIKDDVRHIMETLGLDLTYDHAERASQNSLYNLNFGTPPSANIDTINQNFTFTLAFNI